ncbi:MAG: ABC transporter permease [Spirochaetaceae bacterium]|nr:ABC transporter permease [Spirochaetaceae bacterium]
MLQFIVRRFLSLIPTMFIIVTLGFVIIRAAPGGPFTTEVNVPEVILQQLMDKFHLNESIPRQYLRFLGDLIFRGDLGPSMVSRDFNVSEQISLALPVSATLGLTALTLALLMGVTTGLIAALKQNSIIDYSAMSLAIMWISVPLFVIGPIFILVFALNLGWFPSQGWIDSRAGLMALVLPAVTLALPSFGSFARITRTGVIETLRSDYVRTARAKGLSEFTILTKHVLKGALLPVVTILGPMVAGLVTGSVVIETTFNVPGLGGLLIRSTFNRDYTLMMGGIITYSMILITMNFIVDIVYGFIDPRISYK